MRSAFFLLCFAAVSVWAQPNSARLKVLDASNNEPLPGVVVKVNNLPPVATDGNGTVSVAPLSNCTLRLTLLGYATLDTACAELPAVLRLRPKAAEIQTVVVSAGRYEQKAARLTVSMDVLRPDLIQNKNTTSMESALQQVPGVIINDGQVSIRGGSGFSYGAGSRVMMLVDDLPLLSGDAGDIKFSFLPVENVGQVEVLKGAASVLYGSSALNGVINLRTAQPGLKPETRITIFNGMYDTPMRGSLKWWTGANPVTQGVHALHTRKAGPVDITLGTNIFSDQGYRQGETEQRARFNANLTYRPSQLKGLSLSLATNLQASRGGLFVIWADADSGAYRPAPNSLSTYQTNRYSVDPCVTYQFKKGTRLSFRNRYFFTDNQNNTNQDSRASVLFSEMNLLQRLGKGWMVNAGLVQILNRVSSDSIFGNHSGINRAAYVQVDKNWERLTWSAGVRVEAFSIDGVSGRADLDAVWNGTRYVAMENLPVKPVFRTGLNYRMFEFTFLRASYGQGYRYPSVAEKFTATTSSALRVFPNPDLRPETGSNAEVGLRQGFAIGGFKGAVDAAAFWSEFQQTVEYAFGFYLPPTIKNPFLIDYINHAGFKAFNVGKSRIRGLDIGINGVGKIQKVGLMVLLGYTLVDGISLDSDSSYIKSSSDSSRVLKYRNRHAFKADVQADWHGISLGFSVRYLSFMQAIDRAFQEDVLTYFGGQSGITIVPGLEQYRRIHNTGKTIADLRISYQVNPQVRVSGIVNNVFNIEVMDRPANMRPPRQFMIQCQITL